MGDLLLLPLEVAIKARELSCHIAELLLSDSMLKAVALPQRLECFTLPLLHSSDFALELLLDSAWKGLKVEIREHDTVVMCSPSHAVCNFLHLACRRYHRIMPGTLVL
jgi:hypothetical protein